METPPFTYASFQQFLTQGKLMGSRCSHCGQRYVPPRLICRRCHAGEMDWIEMPLQGKLAAFTTIHVGQSFMVAEGFDRSNPYCVGVIVLGEGVRITARLVDVDARQPEKIAIGMPVKAQFLHPEDKGDGRIVLAFRPIV
ncbi:MAG: Zn-ribbon domain-containing OB-fold protein [Chloroflexota bacterium]|nr:MAG: Zn-ribbon domain-containing OB-fold protein [Chloroflexota bacterium]